jgi:hypothetical protein
LLDSQKNYNIFVFYGGQYNELIADKGDSTKLMIAIDNYNNESLNMPIVNLCSANSGIKHKKIITKLEVDLQNKIIFSLSK